jgi:hypothetical protein
VVGSNFGHAGRQRVGNAQRSVREVHSAQPQVSLWAHAEQILAAAAERRIRYAGRFAQFLHVNRPIEIGLQELFQSPDHGPMTVIDVVGNRRILARDTRDHRLKQSSLQRPSYLGFHKNVGNGLDKMTRSRVQVQHSR